MVGRTLIWLATFLVLTGSVLAQSTEPAARDTTIVRLPMTLEELSNPELEINLWPPKLHAYGLVWLPIGTANEARGVGLGFETVMPFQALGADTSRVSEVAFSFLATTKAQWRIKLSSDFNWNLNRNYLRWQLGFDDLARDFYGIGPASEHHAKEYYQPNELAAFVETTWLVGSRLGIGPRLEFDGEKVDHLEEGGLLASGQIPGTDVSAILGLGLAMIWDSRDDRYRPRSGWYVQAQFVRFSQLGASVHEFSLFNLDARTYLRLRPRQVLALQGFFYGNLGETPFWRLASLGGRTHSRAYSRDRWLDNVLLSGQVEWRWRALRRAGVVAFAGAAVVDERLARLQARYVRPSVGIGIRYFTEQGSEVVPIRLDLAIGYKSWRVSFGIDEAF